MQIGIKKIFYAATALLQRKNDKLTVCKNEYDQLKIIYLNRCDKIKELMTSVQALNRDLDEWNEIEDFAKVIDGKQHPQKTVLEILKYHERDEKERIN